MTFKTRSLLADCIVCDQELFTVREPVAHRVVGGASAPVSTARRNGR